MTARLWAMVGKLRPGLRHNWLTRRHDGHLHLFGATKWPEAQMCIRCGGMRFRSDTDPWFFRLLPGFSWHYCDGNGAARNLGMVNLGRGNYVMTVYMRAPGEEVAVHEPLPWRRYMGMNDVIWTGVV